MPRKLSSNQSLKFPQKSLYYDGDGYEYLLSYVQWVKKQGRFWRIYWFFGIPPFHMIRKVFRAMFK
jgi:hypothetical protein